MTISLDSSAATPAEVRRSLYESIGGAPAVAAAVDSLYERLLADPATAHFFTGMDMSMLRGHMRMFLTGALGGAPDRPGRDLAAAHAHLGIKGEDFDRVAGHLVDTLNSLAVPADLINQIVALVGTLRSAIVSA
jgi:hemoglobin